MYLDTESGGLSELASVRRATIPFEKVDEETEW
jgi:hypothetical protein